MQREFTQYTDHMKRYCITLFFYLLTAGSLPADASVVDFEPERIGWSELQFHAAVLLFSVDTHIVLNRRTAAETDQQLIEPGKGVAVAPDEDVHEIMFTTDFFGRHTTTALLINSATGAALQRTSHDSGKRFRHRIYRFTDIGAYHRTRWPVGKAEEELPADRWPEWSEASEDLRPYPDAATARVVTDPAGLLYIIGAADLDEPGDKTEILAFARGHVHRVEIEVTQPESIKLRYTAREGEAVTERKGKHRAMTLLVRGESLDDEDDDDEFELLGLRGDIVMHMDPETRAPLQLEGRVKIAGKVKLRIKELVVR